MLATADRELTDLLRHRLLRELEVLDQLLVGGRLLERVEVLPVEVLHQGLLQRQDLVHGAHHDGDRGQAGALGGAPASLPRDQLEPVVGQLPDEDGLQDAQLRHGGGQAGQRLLVEVGPRLVRVRRDGSHRHLPKARARLAARDVRRDQRPQPPTQPAAACHRSPPWPAPGTRSRPASSDRTQ